MTILRGGGGSTNMMYVAISAAALKPRIHTQTTIACLLRLRGPGDVALGRDEEDMARSPECRCGHGVRSPRAGRTRSVRRSGTRARNDLSWIWCANVDRSRNPIVPFT